MIIIWVLVINVKRDIEIFLSIYKITDLQVLNDGRDR